jgi:hypothetical protein
LAAVAAHSSVGLQRSFWPLLRRLNASFVAGDDDARFRTGVVQRLQAEGVPVFGVPGGHATLEESPQALADVIRRHLGLEPRAAVPAPAPADLDLAGVAADYPPAAEEWDVKVEAVRSWEEPLKEPLVLSSGPPLTTRRGFHVIVSVGGFRGIGEVSPLPGFHPETWDEARAELAGLAQRISARRLPSLTLDAVEAWAARCAALASVRCGLEQALAMAVARLRGVPLRSLYGPSAEAPVLTNHLVLRRASAGGPSAKAEPSASATARRAVVKVKVGGDPAADAVRVARSAQGATELRLDANQVATHNEIDGLGLVPWRTGSPLGTCLSSVGNHLVRALSSVGPQIL